MLRKRAKPGSGESSEQRRELAAFDDHGHGGAISALFVASSGEASPERQPEAVLMMTSPTSTLQTASGATSPAAAVTCGSGRGAASGSTAVPFSRRRNDGAGRGGRCKSHRPWDARPVGLGLVGALNDDAEEGVYAPDDVSSAAAASSSSSSSASASAMTGQRPRAQTNYYTPWSPSPVEFRVNSSSGRGCAGAAAAVDQQAPPRRRCMSPGEMEMSEDYTCVIARGPNPRTTHIFDNRVVRSSGACFPAEIWLPSAGKDDGFLRYCHGCSKDLGLGKDIFMYRGEKAFCSRECRHHEMLFDEGIEEL